MTKDDAAQIEKLGYDHPIVKTVLRLDREVGEIKGELKWIRLATFSTFGAVIGQWVLTLL